jgi:hypothetical protein
MAQDQIHQSRRHSAAQKRTNRDPGELLPRRHFRYLRHDEFETFLDRRKKSERACSASRRARSAKLRGCFNGPTLPPPARAIRAVRGASPARRPAVSGARDWPSSGRPYRQPSQRAVRTAPARPQAATRSPSSRAAMPPRAVRVSRSQRMSARIGNAA